MAKRIPYIPNRVIDTNGISDGATIDVFQTGTTTRVSIYSDEALTTPLANPYTVSAGAAVPAIYHGETANIRVKVTQSDGTTISDDDPFEAPVTDVALASTDAGKGAALVGFKSGQAGAVARTVSQKLEDILFVEDFGAVGDNTADDTLAIQAMIDALGYFRLRNTTYKITDSLIIPAGGPYGAEWSGQGMEQSILNCVGMAGKGAIQTETATELYRVIMRDFKVQGDCDRCIDFNLTSGLLYASHFENLWLSATAESSIRSVNDFSCSFVNCHTFSTGGHGFELEGGVCTSLINCYAHTSGTGKAGYRIKEDAVLVGCNGVDSGGDIWGEFGASTDLDGANRQFNIKLLNCNIEDWESDALVFRYTGALRMENTPFVAKATGTYDTLIRQNPTGATTEWSLVINNCSVTTKGSTMSDVSQIMVSGGPAVVDVDGTQFTDLRRVDQSVTYTIPRRTTKNSAYQVLASEYQYIDWLRAYGFVLQVPTLWTDGATNMSVTRRNTIKTDNAGATTIQYASGGELGQRLTIIIQDANTTIKHNHAANGRFLNTSGADIVAASGDVYEYVHNGTNWKQVG